MTYEGKTKELSGYDPETTNNRMELTAVIKGLEALKEKCKITITTDSEYVKKGMMEWIENWKLKGWKTSGRKPVKNKDLWEVLDALTSKHEVTWKWIRGHSGHPQNERCDKMANKAINLNQ